MISIKAGKGYNTSAGLFKMCKINDFQYEASIDGKFLGNQLCTSKVAVYGLNRACDMEVEHLDQWGTPAEFHPEGRCICTEMEFVRSLLREISGK